MDFYLDNTVVEVRMNLYGFIKGFVNIVKYRKGSCHTLKGKEV